MQTSSTNGNEYFAELSRPVESAGEEWFALSVRPRAENTVVVLLASKGYDVLAPTRREPKRLCDRIKTINKPVFPGYLFCRFQATKRLPILITPGVRSIVGSGKEPTPISKEEIDALLRVLESGFVLKDCPFVEKGRVVEVIDGPLRGVRGVVLSRGEETRLVVSITLLRRCVAVQLDRADLQFLSVGTRK